MYTAMQMKVGPFVFCLMLLVPPSVHAAEELAAETITVAGEVYRVIPDEVFRKMGFEFPDVPPEENAAYDYIEAINQYTPIKDADFRDLYYLVIEKGWDHAPPMARVHADGNQITFELLRAGAGKDQCHFPFLEVSSPLSSEPLWNMYNLFGAKVREMARFLRFVGSMHEHDGDFAAAMDAYVDAAALGVHVSQDNQLLDALVGMAISRIGLHSVRACAARRQVADKVLLAAQQRLAKIRGLRPSCLDVVGSERVFSREALECLFREKFLSGGWPNVLSLEGWLEGFLLNVPAVQDAIRLGNNRFWETFEAVAALPVAEYLEHHERLLREPPIPSFLAVVGSLASREPIIRFRFLYERENIEWIVTDVFVAIARYRAKHGQFPEKLEDVKDLMLTDGIDPFSGEVLEYRREGDEFVVWSVWQNLKDDRGEVTRTLPMDAADLVWTSAPKSEMMKE